MKSNFIDLKFGLATFPANKTFLQFLDLRIEITGLYNKLKNKAYVTNAPKEIVQNDKNLLEELTIEDGKLRSIVSSIN